MGKKQFFLAKQGVTGCKSKTSDRRSYNWSKKCWKDSDWRTYKGSSPSLKKWMKKYPDHEYRYEILHQCYNKSELFYKEIEEIVMRGALWQKHGDGTFLYFNQSLPAMRFRVEERVGEKPIFYNIGD